VLRRLVSLLLLLAIAAALFVAFYPQGVGLQREYVVAQAVAFRGALAAVAIVLTIVFLFAAVVLRPLRRLLAAVAVLLLAFAAVTGGVVVERGIGGPSFRARTAGDVTVLAWNTKGGAPGAAAIADLALSTHADIVSLPETRKTTADQVAALLKKHGITMSVLTLAYDQLSPADSTSLLVSSKLGRYGMESGAQTTKILPTVVARPEDGTGPVIVAAHPVAPVKAYMAEWRHDLAYLARLCSGENMIMAGDFNSTLDHQAGLGSKSNALGRCSDAAKAAGSAGVGTWPTNVPALAGTPIDHIMTTVDWRVSGMRVITSEDGAGSDHRPVVAQLTPTS
jgi:endonuclease/exonuclease/phosphatase (EEP) superfamily protein YafD